MVLMAPVSASITRRFGARTTLIAGLLVTGFGYVVHVLFDASVVQVILGVCVVSVGIAVSYAAMPVLIMQSVPISETAAANGLNTVVRSIGTSTCSATVAAVLAAGTVAGGAYPSEASLHSMNWLAAVAAFLGAAVGVPHPGSHLACPRSHPATRPGERPAAVRADTMRRVDAARRGRGARPGAAHRTARPARLAVVSVLDRSGRQADWARADNDGRWSVVLPGGGGVPGRLRRGRLGRPVRAARALTRVPSILEIDERLTVAGVVSRGGWPIDDALVVLTDASGESVGATRTDDDGHYELGLPPLGRYILTALDQSSGMAESQDVVSQCAAAALQPRPTRAA